MMLHGFIIMLITGLCRGQEFSCPLDADSVCMDGLFGDPYDCTLYHECFDCQYSTEMCSEGLHFDDEFKICRTPYLAGCDPKNYPRNGSAFCVTRGNGRIDGPINPLIFSESYVNYKYPYDPLTGFWQASQTGVYFFHMSGGLYPARKINMTLAGTPYPFNVVRDSQLHEYDVVSRDVLMTLNMFSVVATTLESDCSVNSDAGKQTMWTGFNLDELMNDVIAFYAVSNVFQTSPKRIVFEDERVNMGGGYDPETGVFTAPVTGTYYFTFSSGVESQAVHRSRFCVSQAEGCLTELWRGAGINEGIDTLSKSLVYFLNVGDSIWIDLIEGDATNNQSTLLAFGGFLYNPKPPTSHVAWFVTTATTQTGPLDPVVFENQVVDVGGVFDEATSTVHIPVSGYYYMNIYTGVSPDSGVSIQIITQTGSDDPQMVAEARRSEPHNPAVDTFGRGLMVHLSAGSDVRIRLEGESVSYSDSNKLTTFSGFLLFAIEEP